MYETLLDDFTVHTHIMSVEVNIILVSNISIVTRYAEVTGCGVSMSRASAVVCHVVVNYVTCY